MAEKTEAKPSAVLDKKALQTWRRKHDLHVLLIMERDGLSKPNALVQAYHEGIEGLQGRK